MAEFRIKENSKISRLSELFIIIFILIASFGTLVFSFLYGLSDAKIFAFLPGVKDFLLLLTILIILLRILLYDSFILKYGDIKIYICIALFLAFFLLSSFVIDGSFMEKAIILRRWMLPLLVILIYINVAVDKHKLTSYLNIICIILALFGFVEYVLPFDFWNNIIKLPKYWGASGLDRSAKEVVDYSGRFISTDLFFLIGDVMRRMVSGFCEPTNFASFMMAAFIILKKHAKTRFLCLLCCLLAMSKAAIIGIFMVYPSLLFCRKCLGIKKYHLLYMFTFIPLYILAVFFHELGFVQGPFSHLNGLYGGIDTIFEGNIFGHGVASAGNFAALNSDSDVFAGESGRGGMLAQIGFGTIFYIGVFYNMLKILSSDIRSHFDSITLIFVWTMVFAYSESSFGASGNILFWVYPAIDIYWLYNRKAS